MLAGKWVLVTGASRGIGRAIALAYAKERANLVLTSRSVDQLNAVAEESKRLGAAECEVRACDMSQGAQVDELCTSLLAKHGCIDVLVNNAGIAVSGNPLEGDCDEWEKMMAVNVHAPMRTSRLLAPAMAEKGWGCIVNVGSIAGLEPMNGAAYATSKHALRGWSRSSYQVLRNKNIKVVLISPAFVATDMSANAKGALQERMLKPEDVAEAALLPIRTSSACVPEEITLRLTLSAYPN